MNLIDLISPEELAIALTDEPKGSERRQLLANVEPFIAALSERTQLLWEELVESEAAGQLAAIVCIDMLLKKKLPQ